LKNTDWKFDKEEREKTGKN